MYNPYHNANPKPVRKVKRSRAIPAELVMAVLIRDNWTCQSCRKMYPPDSHALHIHHLIYKSQGGTTTMENLATVCWKCHREIHDLHGWKEYELLKKFITADSSEEFENKILKIAERLGV